MTATLERLREEAPDLSLSARSSASVPEQPPVHRQLDDLNISVLLEGRLPGGRILEQTFLLHDLVEHRGEPALICSCPDGRRRRFLLRHLDAITDTSSGRTYYDPETWFSSLIPSETDVASHRWIE